MSPPGYKHLHYLAPRAAPPGAIRLAGVPGVPQPHQPHQGARLADESVGRRAPRLVSGPAGRHVPRHRRPPCQTRNVDARRRDDVRLEDWVLLGSASGVGQRFELRFRDEHPALHASPLMCCTVRWVKFSHNFVSAGSHMFITCCVVAGAVRRPVRKRNTLAFSVVWRTGRM